VSSGGQGGGGGPGAVLSQAFVAPSSTECASRPPTHPTLAGKPSETVPLIKSVAGSPESSLWRNSTVIDVVEKVHTPHAIGVGAKLQFGRIGEVLVFF